MDGSLRRTKQLRLRRIIGQRDRDRYFFAEQTGNDCKFLHRKARKAVKVHLCAVKQRALRQLFQHPRQLVARIGQLLCGQRFIDRVDQSDIAQLCREASLHLLRGGQHLFSCDRAAFQLVNHGQQLPQQLGSARHILIHRQRIRTAADGFKQHQQLSRLGQHGIRKPAGFRKDAVRRAAEGEHLTELPAGIVCLPRQLSLIFVGIQLRNDQNMPRLPVLNHLCKQPLCLAAARPSGQNAHSVFLLQIDTT